MRLTQFTDYALRTVLYLGANGDRLVSVNEIAKSYQISYHHLTKVTALLVELRVIESTRGRGGGMRLRKDPADINIGWLVRHTESDFALVACFDTMTDTCPITPACKLRHVLQDALQRFMSALDEYTLADFLATPARRNQLVQLWRAAAAA